MAGISADYINPFLIAARTVLKDIVSIDAKLGKPYMKNKVSIEHGLIITLGISGKLSGLVTICFDDEIALEIASKMCMMKLDRMGELAESAISELCNMILGNTATVYSNNGIAIDITPPTIAKNIVDFTNTGAVNICIPLLYDISKEIEINVAMKEN